eukprot:257640_1
MAFNTTVNESADMDMDEYYRQSAEKCCCNKTCSCCTCRCCALFILICWIIFGCWGAYDAITWMQKTSEWTTIDPCIAADYNTGPCCVGTTDILGSASIIYVPGTCDAINTAYTISLVQNILSCLSGIAGVIGLIIFFSWLILVPFGWSILSIILNVVLLILIGFGSFLAGYGGAVVAVFIAILFFMNWRIMRDAASK